MGFFQCSSSWGYPEVKDIRYQAYRNYSGISFSFDRVEKIVVAESTKIHDASVLCFSWDFSIDDSICEELDRLVSVGRLSELSCEKAQYAVPAFWSAEVGFDGKRNCCSSSSDYPFSVLAFEEGLMQLMNNLAKGIDADPCEAESLTAEFSSDGLHLEFCISQWKEISIGTAGSSGMIWRTYDLSENDSESIIGMMKDYPINRPANYIGHEGSDVGSLIFRFGNRMYRIDVDGEGPNWWKELLVSLLPVIQNIAGLREE